MKNPGQTLSSTSCSTTTRKVGSTRRASLRIFQEFCKKGLIIGFSLIAVLALMVTSPRVQSSIGAGIVQTIKAVEPFCTDFNDKSLHGWGNGDSNVNMEIRAPGPSEQASDSFFHATDQSGPSWISASPDYRGDWTKLAEKGCGALCWDTRVFDDGFDGGHIGDDQVCTDPLGSPCQSGTYRPILPSLILISDPDGPGGNPPLRAVYRANTFITENDGSNPGWHHICAPLALLTNGNLPSDTHGAWQMADNAPNSSWSTLLANITDVQFGIDFTSNVEKVGYDNFCLSNNACPQETACATIVRKEAVCKADGSGGYSYPFNVINNSGKDVVQVLLTPQAGSGITLSQQVFPLTTPLPNGQTTTMNVDIGNVKPGTKPCFYVTLMTKDGPCCTVTVCPSLPDCCATATGKFQCNAKGTYTGTFSIVNTSPNTIKNIYLYPPANVTMSQTYFAVTLAPGQSFTTPVITISKPKPGKFCFRVSMHTEDMKECCSVDVCMVLPECGDSDGQAQ